LFTRKKKKKTRRKKTKQACKIKECSRLVVEVRSLRRKECGEAQEPRKSSSRSKRRRRRRKRNKKSRIGAVLQDWWKFDQRTDGRTSLAVRIVVVFVAASQLRFIIFCQRSRG
jgi:hypothetical protein